VTPALELRELAVRRGGREVLTGVSLVAPPGLVLLTGANGSGKSTLITAIAGVVPPAHGVILVDGHDLERDGLAAKRQLGWLPERADVLEHLIARRWVALVASLRQAELEPSMALAEEVLDRAALDRPIGALSAGQRRKLAMVVALCGEPRLLLLDEPTNALDVAGLALLDRTIERWREAGRTIVCAVHRPERFEHAPDVRWHVEGGRVEAG
jgi:ABC-type multidrug transport system ATPase subunit